MRILVAEDEADICEILAELLGGAGHEVAFANTFPIAERMLDSEAWDIMVTDRGMPGGDGMALAEAASARGMKAVLCTGYAQSVEELRQRGIGYLQKPFSLDALLAKIEAPV